MAPTLRPGSLVASWSSEAVGCSRSTSNSPAVQGGRCPVPVMPRPFRAGRLTVLPYTTYGGAGPQGRPDAERPAGRGGRGAQLVAAVDVGLVEPCRGPHVRRPNARTASPAADQPVLGVLRREHVHVDGGAQ